MESLETIDTFQNSQQQYSESIEQWDCTNVCHWLHSLNLLSEQVQKAIEEHEIDGESILNIPPYDIVKEMNIRKMLTRRNLQQAFNSLVERHNKQSMFSVLKIANSMCKEEEKDDLCEDFSFAKSIYMKEINNYQDRLSDQLFAMNLNDQEENKTKYLEQSEVDEILIKDQVCERDFRTAQEVNSMRSESQRDSYFLQRRNSSIHQEISFHPDLESSLLQNQSLSIESLLNTTSQLQVHTSRLGPQEEKKSGFFHLACLVCQGKLKQKKYFEYKCKHLICGDCLANFFRLAMRPNEKALWPLECCKQKIDMRYAEQVLTHKEYSQFIKMSEQHLSSNNMYCQVPICSEFINLDKLSERKVKCPNPRCKTEHCQKCKSRYHDDPTLCSKNRENENLLQEIANKFGWKKCDKCNHMIELDHGCNHMICKCGHQFCYECGKQWKNCKCNQWTERNLYNEQQRRIVQMQERINREMTGQEMVELMQNVETQCGNGRHSFSKIDMGWNSVNDNCRNCSYYLKHYFHQCTVCEIRVCNTCRFNRRTIF